MKAVRALGLLALAAGLSSTLACRRGGTSPEGCHPTATPGRVVLLGVGDLSMATFSGTCEGARAGAVNAAGDTEVLVYSATAGASVVSCPLNNSATSSLTVPIAWRVFVR